MHRSLFTSCWKVNMISSTLFPHRHQILIAPEMPHISTVGRLDLCFVPLGAFPKSELCKIHSSMVILMIQIVHRACNTTYFYKAPLVLLLRVCCGRFLMMRHARGHIMQETILTRSLCPQLFLYSVDHEKCTDMIPGFYLLIASLHKAIFEAPEAIKRSALAKLPQTGAGGNTTLMGRICENVSAKLDDANQVKP